MLGTAWIALRQAQEALKNGRLEEAHRLLVQPGVHGHKGSWELLQQIVDGFLARAEQHLRHDDPAAAWNDLVLAEQVGTTGGRTAALRQTLTRLGLAEARALLEAGEPSRALEAVSRLRERAAQHPELDLLEQAARSWSLARELAGRGEFSQAVPAIERAGRLLPNSPPALARCRLELERHAKEFGDLLLELHRAVSRESWREALQAAERVLAVAPQHPEARKARSRAWKSVEPDTLPGPRPAAPAAAASGAAEASRRFVLWTDGVGGFLVCLGARVTLGQAAPEAGVDVPLFADVSRTHAVLTRDAEGYLLEALRPVQVNGNSADKALLQPGDRITLGGSCQLRFSQPVPVSATARLDVVSGHRLPLSLDGILLMADTLVLGPTAQAHVRVPDLKQPVMLFRAKDSLGVRYAGDLVVDGRSYQERATLAPASRVTGDEFAFAVEPLAVRTGSSL